jgi:hypothetical protein
MASASRVRFQTYHGNVVVTVTGGDASPVDVYVNLHGTVQFLNADSIDYRVRLRANHDRHADGPHPDVDVLLPARGSFTLVVDPATILDGECKYELFPLNLPAFTDFVRNLDDVRAIAEGGGALRTEEMKSAKSGGSSGGGTIKVG